MVRIAGYRVKECIGIYKFITCLLVVVFFSLREIYIGVSVSDFLTVSDECIYIAFDSSFQSSHFTSY